VDAFDREAVGAARIDFDRFEVGIFRQQQQAPVPVLQTLDRDFVIEPCDDDAAIPGSLRAMHGEQVAVEDAGIAHAHADDAQQEIGTWPEQRRVDGVVRFDIAFGHDRAAGGNASDEGERCRRCPRAFCQTQAAMLRQAFQHTFADQRLDIILR